VRTLVTLIAGVCLTAALVRIDAPPVVWTPSGPLQLCLAGAGVLLALVAVLTRPRCGAGG
jgi:hypothetical protein